MSDTLTRFNRCLIGIGRDLTVSPLPHHRTYGSRSRRFGRVRQGDRDTPTGASAPGVPATSSSQRPSITRPLAGCDLAAPPQTTTPLYRSGLPTNMRGTMPSADFCGAVRKDSSPLSPRPGHPADLPRSAVIPSAHRRRMYQVRPVVDGGLRGGVPTRPERTTPHIRFVSLAPHLRSTRPSDPTAR
jgi:hypothetical protein